MKLEDIKEPYKSAAKETVKALLNVFDVYSVILYGSVARVELYNLADYSDEAAPLHVEMDYGRRVGGRLILPSEFVTEEMLASLSLKLALVSIRPFGSTQPKSLVFGCKELVKEAKFCYRVAFKFYELWFEINEKGVHCDVN